MTDTKDEAQKQKPPLICRMCKIGLVSYHCKACPPVSVEDLPMTEEEAHILNIKMRYDSEAEGIVSKPDTDPESIKKIAKLKSEIDEYKKNKEQTP